MARRKSLVKPTRLKLFSFDPRKNVWSPVPTANVPYMSSHHPNTCFLSLISWNVDFAAPLLVRRFQAALSHLEQLISSESRSTSPPPPPTIILLQEVDASCFTALLSNTFIRASYQVSNISSPQSYSTLTLVPHALAPLVSAVSRVPFAETRMQRDCLYLDLDIPLSDADALAPKKTFRIRIANTHLESLNGFGDKARPKQLDAVAKLLSAPDVDGGLVAGDMNCISPSDRDLPAQVGLSDAWLPADAAKAMESGADETGEAEGHTWGYQPRCEYPPQRLDKILTVGKIEAIGIQRVGVGLQVQVEGRDVWVSDHYGLLAQIFCCS
ncbi:Endonuclease/exonuclease/phosphatase [Mycena belliarum]|uniref:Endonuclease/exonuclease/phosphatase n=1 Tax=Mycena belliarum TaxID=1033014 RepID=A0AAD6UEJ2_9AGAR|nr:Endonuclease/exonuclease/phosphatase [Mycena belliae]